MKKTWPRLEHRQLLDMLRELELQPGGPRTLELFGASVDAFGVAHTRLLQVYHQTPQHPDLSRIPFMQAQKRLQQAKEIELYAHQMPPRSPRPRPDEQMRLIQMHEDRLPKTELAEMLGTTPNTIYRYNLRHHETGFIPLEGPRALLAWWIKYDVDTAKTILYDQLAPLPEHADGLTLGLRAHQRPDPTSIVQRRLWALATHHEPETRHGSLHTT